MTANIGSIDRIVRIVLAVLLAGGGITALAVFKMTLIAIILFVLAGVMLITSLIRVCPLYLPFKINTNKK